ncbi:MAG: PKD domain-containing protein [Vicinamibacterales bacterium]
MSRNTGSALQRRVALAVIAVLTVNPSMMVASGPPEAAPPAAVAPGDSVMVESEPAGAAVYVDGQLTGQTPLHVSGLSAGDHRVRLVKGGYLENARLVSVGAAASTVRVRLTRDAGSRPELAAQLGGGGGGGGGGRSKLPLYLALAGGGGVAAYFLLKDKSHAPSAGSISFSPATAVMATLTTLTAVGAADEDGDTLSFAWDFGDGTAAGTGETVTHIYTTAGTKTVTLTVSDGESSATTTGSLVVKSLVGTWTGLLNCCGPLNTILIVTSQSGTTLTGTESDQAPQDAANFTGSVNPTTRQVTLNFTLTQLVGSFSFVGTLNAAATTLTGVTSNLSGSGPPNGTTWTMSRP